MNKLFENWRKYQESLDEDMLMLEMKEFFETTDRLLMLNEADFKKYFQSLPQKFKEKWKLIKMIAAEGKMKVSQVVVTFKANNGLLYQILSFFKWSGGEIVKALKKGLHLYKELQLALAHAIEKQPQLKALIEAGRLKSKDLDAWLEAHPKLKAAGGLAVGGLLLLIWLNMSFTGDFAFDFDGSHLVAALAGNYSLHDLFLSESGIRMLTLFATGVISGLSFPWLKAFQSGQAALVMLTFGLAKYYAQMKKNVHERKQEGEKMRYLFESWRGYLNEQILIEGTAAAALEKEMENVFKTAAQQLTTIEPEEEERKEGIEEALGIGIAAGFALALPKILEIIGKVTNWGGTKIKKIIGKSGETDETKIGKTIIHFAHGMHKLYLKPIAFSVKALSKKFELNLSNDQISKISNLIFHTIVAGFLVYSGVGTASALSTGSMELATLEGAMTEVKTQELRAFIIEFITEIATA